MKRIIAITLLVNFFCHLAFSQSDENIKPKSLLIAANGNTIPTLNLPPLKTDEIARLSAMEDKDGTFPQFAKYIGTHITLDNAGTWTALADGGRIWRVELTSAGALALIPYFNKLYIPTGATLHFYMPDKREVLGAFTNLNTPQPIEFCPGYVHGDKFIIEYYEPEGEKGKGVIDIDKVAYAYRWIDPLPIVNDNERSGSCEVNEICSEGDNWRNQIRSVVRLMVAGADGTGFCSGSLINNTRLDCTPYIISADHCTGGAATAAQFNQWVFYFNYQATTCTGNSGSAAQAITGCKKIAESDDHGGGTGSDFLLVQMNSTPSSAYNVFYAGWDNSGDIPNSGVCVHHPLGDIKKISAFNGSALSDSWGDSALDTHISVQWLTTAHGHGVTEKGSSGSPLFNENGLIVGHLTGGSSCCIVNDCGLTTGPNERDKFGMIAYDWNSDGVVPARQLQPWLDPENTGAVTLQGTNPPCGTNVQNDVGVIKVVVPASNICSTSFTPSFLLRNFGANTITSVKVKYNVDGGNLLQLTWLGTLAAGQVTTVNLAPVNLGTGTHNIIINTSLPNGVTDANSGNDYLSYNFTVYPPSGLLNLSITTDDDGAQNSWIIRDAQTLNTVASGGPFFNVTGGRQYDIPLCLATGCYDLIISDDAHDGMIEGNDGNVTVYYGATAIAHLPTPDFGSADTMHFCIDLNSISEITPRVISIMPNPSNGVFKVLFSDYSHKSISVYNSIGQVVYTSVVTGPQTDLDLSPLAAGVYILKAESTLGTGTQKLVIK